MNYEKMWEQLRHNLELKSYKLVMDLNNNGAKLKEIMNIVKENKHITDVLYMMNELEKGNKL